MVNVCKVDSTLVVIPIENVPLRVLTFRGFGSSRPHALYKTAGQQNPLLATSSIFST